MKNQTTINQYFSTHWKSANFGSYKYSGFELINKVLPKETVLDVGCGYGGLLVELSPLFPDKYMLGKSLSSTGLHLLFPYSFIFFSLKVWKFA